MVRAGTDWGGNSAVLTGKGRVQLVVANATSRNGAMKGIECFTFVFGDEAGLARPQPPQNFGNTRPVFAM